MPQVSRILLLLSLVLLAYPADCPDTTAGGSNETQILLDGEGYVLANGEQRAFYQGYSIVIKGVDGGRGCAAVCSIEEVCKAAAVIGDVKKRKED